MKDMHNKDQQAKEQQSTHNSQEERVVEREEVSSQASAVSKQEEESYKNQLLRMSADFSNYRRRTEKERSELVQIGQVAIVKAFLPLLDDVERAFEAAKAAAAEGTAEHAGLKSTLEGLALVEKNMRKILSELGVEEVSTRGQFDPHIHEALMQAAVEGTESGTILQTFNKGYIYKGTVIRHAKVSVAA